MATEQSVKRKSGVKDIKEIQELDLWGKNWLTKK